MESLSFNITPTRSVTINREIPENEELRDLTSDFSSIFNDRDFVNILRPITAENLQEDAFFGQIVTTCKDKLVEQFSEAGTIISAEVSLDFITTTLEKLLDILLDTTTEIIFNANEVVTLTILELYSDEAQKDKGCTASGGDCRSCVVAGCGNIGNDPRLEW